MERDFLAKGLASQANFNRGIVTSFSNEQLHESCGYRSEIEIECAINHDSAQSNLLDSLKVLAI